MLIRRLRGWEIDERKVTPEPIYMQRRQLLGGLAAAGAGLGSLLSGCSIGDSLGSQGGVPGNPDAVRYPDGPAGELYPVERNPKFSEADAGRPVTPPEIAHAYNNFYEFFTVKHEVWTHVDGFETQPWELEIAGLVEHPGRLDLGDLMRKMPLEERVCRLRCVEAWSAVVPWTGFPLRALIDLVQPLSSANYVALTTALRPQQMPGVPAQPWYPWPYQEALTLEEARNELTLLATGLYGRPLPKQNGAPIRLVVPWKYGFKNIKSIVRLEFTAEQPSTLWSGLIPDEYGFWANINPEVPHPRWSQATELFVNTGERVPTELYNGYGEWVAEMYDGLKEDFGIWLYR